MDDPTSKPSDHVSNTDDRYNIQHNPRKKAKPPMMPILPKEPVASTAPQVTDADGSSTTGGQGTSTSMRSTFLTSFRNFFGLSQASNSGHTVAPGYASLISDQQLEHAREVLEEQRVGPHLVKYGTYMGAAAVVYTYLQGFRAYAAQDNLRWLGSVKLRVRILGPLITMYCTSNNVLPFPFKQSIEDMLQRRALCMYDIVTAKQVLRAGQQLSS